MFGGGLSVEGIPVVAKMCPAFTRVLDGQSVITLVRLPRVDLCLVFIFLFTLCVFSRCVFGEGWPRLHNVRLLLMFFGVNIVCRSGLHLFRVPFAKLIISTKEGKNCAGVTGTEV